MTKFKSSVAFVAFAVTLCLGDESAQPKFLQLSPKFYVSTQQVNILFN